MKRRVVTGVLALLGISAAGAFACSNDDTGGESEFPSTVGDGGADAQALAPGECFVDDDCRAESCLFPVGAACGGHGTCMALLPPDGAACDDPPSCSCDGTPRDQPCNLPAGFTRGAIVHAGRCADGTQECSATAPCPGVQYCGFRASDGCSVTTAHCFDGPDPTVATPGIIVALCACDGGISGTFPGSDGIVSAPFLSARCPTPDAGSGADASDAADAD